VIRSVLVGVAIVGLAMLETARAADVYVYPAKGQSKQQQERDQFDCYNWAKQQTGFDPSKPVAQATPAGRRAGGAVRGAAGGAALGAIGGAIGGDAGKGAAIGAGVGGTVGAVRHHRANQQAAASEQQTQQRYAADRDGYNRAYAACLSGRGYTVK
jgi:hypothetical protein